MSNYPLLLFILLSAFLNACSRKTYTTNGERIYMTGENLQGEKLLDKSASRITIAKSCKTCHGKSGDRMKTVSIKFSDLSDPTLAAPYNDSLFYRFIDHDLKSDGSKANIGVIWKMSEKDKADLLDYLKRM